MKFLKLHDSKFPITTNKNSKETLDRQGVRAVGDALSR